MMTLLIEPELETKLCGVAQKMGQNADSYAQTALLRQIAADESRLDKEWLRQEFERAAADPLFLQDMHDSQEAFAPIDAETARMLEND